MQVRCVVFLYCSTWQNKKLANLGLIEIHSEIFLLYKLHESGNHLEKEPAEPMN